MIIYGYCGFMLELTLAESVLRLFICESMPLKLEFRSVLVLALASAEVPLPDDIEVGVGVGLGVGVACMTPVA